MVDERQCKTGSRVRLSVVIPVYQSASIFPELHRRLTAALSSVVPSYEVIAVVDSTTDTSADEVAAIREQDERVKLIEFTRNFGHQVAITAGLHYACGDLVAIMDDDLEDPPEVLPRMIEKADEGYDLVYGVRRKRKVGPFWRLLYFGFYRVLNSLSSIDIPCDTGDFCLMRRPLVDCINSMPEKNRFIRGMRCWAGLRQIGIEYERGVRWSGESGYSLRSYAKFALDGVLSFSYRPLHVVSMLGFVIASLSFLYALFSIIKRLCGFAPEGTRGWTSLMVVLLFLGGVQLISVGVIGQYIARIYDEVKRRPQYFTRRVLGFDVGEDGTEGHGRQ